jgi:hypothetical protein
MHLRATMSDDLLSWLPTWKLPLPQVGALWAPVLFHVPPRAARRGSGISAPLLLLYTESSSCIRERPKLGDQVTSALHPTSVTYFLVHVLKWYFERYFEMVFRWYFVEPDTRGLKD